MISNSLAIRRRLEDFRDSLEIFAGLLASKGHRIVFKGTMCATDGKTIYLPSLDILEGTDKTEDEIAVLIRNMFGFVYHEVGHLLFTDWDVWESVAKSKPQISALTNVFEDAFVERELAKIWPGSTEPLGDTHRYIVEENKETYKELSVFQQVTMLLAFLCRGRSFNYAKRHFDEEVVRWVDQNLDDEITAATDIKRTSDSWKLAKKVYKKVKAAMKQASEPPPPPQQLPPPPPPMDDDEEEASNPPLPDMDDDDEEEGEDEDGDEAAGGGDEEGEGDDGEDGEGDDADGDDSDDDSEEDDSGMSGDDTNQQREGDEDEDDEGEASQVGGDGDAGDEEEEGEGDAEAEGDDGDEEADEEDEGNGQAQLEDDDSYEGGMVDPTDIGRFLAEEFAEASEGSEAYAPYSREGDRIGPIEERTYSDLACTMPISSRHYSVTCSSNLAEAEDAVRALVGPLKSALSRVLKARATAYSVRDLDHGKLDKRRLWKIPLSESLPARPRVRKETIQQESFQNLTVILAVNESSSMSIRGRMSMAVAATLVIGDVLDSLGIRFGIAGHTTGYYEVGRLRYQKSSSADKYLYSRWGDLAVDWVKTPSQAWGQRRRYMGMLESTDNTYDAEAVRYFSRYLQQDRAERRVLMMIDDGEPCPNVHQFVYKHSEELVKAVQEASESGVECVGIGINTSSVTRYYPDSAVVNDLDELPDVMLKKFGELLGLSRKGRGAK